MSLLQGNEEEFIQHGQAKYGSTRQASTFHPNKMDQR